MKKTFSNFFSPKKQEMGMTDQYRKWRDLIFSLKPESSGVSSKEANRVFGILTDNVQFDKETTSGQYRRLHLQVVNPHFNQQLARE